MTVRRKTYEYVASALLSLQRFPFASASYRCLPRCLALRLHVVPILSVAPLRDVQLAALLNLKSQGFGGN
jgi:hypothetical protein